MAGDKIKVGFLSPMGATGDHFDRFSRFVPDEVTLEVGGLDLIEGPLNSMEGKEGLATDLSVRSISDNPGWQTVAILAAPVQVIMPNLAPNVRGQVSIPVTTAMESAIAALSALGASRVLLMTPFDESMNVQIRAFLAERGIEAFSGPQPAPYYRDAAKLGPDEVYGITKEGLANAGAVDAIYFQGAVLDALEIIDRLESELGLPVVASNPAMLWHALSLLGHGFSVPNGGRLLREWPSLKN
jgi:hypothetical protein